MKKYVQPQKIVASIGSPKFFGVILAFLVAQAVWIALSGRYPMAFDEDFHLGIIRLYAHHLSPFWSSQPPGADMYGAVARDPSYLYHFIFGFIYRAINCFTHNQTAQVLCLRALNIGLFASGLVLFRRLLLKTKASAALVNVSLLTFVLIPIVPFLAAQINYDNLLLPLTATALLLTIRFYTELKERQRFNLPILVALLINCLLASLVKYAFIPIFISILLYVAIGFRKVFRNSKQSRTLLRGSIVKSIKSVGPFKFGVLMVCLLLALILFSERYGINIVRYHTPLPDCSKVLSTRQCSAYGPWIRDYNFSINKVAGAHSPLVYIGDWTYGMWLRLFFAVDGPASNFETRGPLIVPAFSAVVFAVIGALSALFHYRRILRRYDSAVWTLLLATAGLYVGILFLDNYRGWLRTGQPVAINGRYLFPVLLPCILLCVIGWHEALRRRPRLQAVFLALGILCLLWGGGVLTYILRSRDAWYWPSPAVRTANRVVRSTVGPYTPGYRYPTEFLH